MLSQPLHRQRTRVHNSPYSCSAHIRPFCCAAALGPDPFHSFLPLGPVPFRNFPAFAPVPIVYSVLFHTFRRVPVQACLPFPSCPYGSHTPRSVHLQTPSKIPEAAQRFLALWFWFFLPQKQSPSEADPAPESFHRLLPCVHPESSAPSSDSRHRFRAPHFHGTHVLRFSLPVHSGASI